MTINHGYKFGVAFDVTVHGTGSNQKVKDESLKVANDNNADSSAVAVVIKRLPVKYAGPIDKARSKIYAHLARNSMNVNGMALVPLSKVDAFEKGLNEAKDEYMQAVGVLLADCESGDLLIEMEKLGDFKDQVKTLDCNDIRSRFGVTILKSLDFENPIVKGMLSKMDSEVVTRLKKDCERDAKISYDKAVTEIVAHVSGPINNLLKKLISKLGVKGTHVKTIVEDIRSIVEELPAYNVINDSGVSDTIAEIYKQFGTLTEGDLKDEKTVETVKENAKGILERFKAITPKA